MSLSSKVVLSFLAGCIAGAVSWVLVDFNGVYSLPAYRESASFIESFLQQAFIGAIFGMLVGLAVGIVNGLSTGSMKAAHRAAVWGLCVGICGGLAGLFFGQLFFGYLYVDPMTGTPGALVGPLLFAWNVIIRAIGWALIGLFVGLVQGLPIHSSKAARHGAVGGFIGGFLGGTLFEVTPYILPPGLENPGILCRGISLTITGASTGLFVGLVETLLKQAWIRILTGRNEGREYVITKNQTTLGRDELSDIGLFGDRNIAPLHATIEAKNGRYVIRNVDTGIGTTVNGTKIVEQVLHDGDIIQIGSIRLEFHEKPGRSKIAEPIDTPPPQKQVLIPENTCPFCGKKKNPLTGACSCQISTTPIIPHQSDQWRLTGVNSQYIGQSFALKTPTPTRIGRNPECDVVLALDPTVSRNHARIEFENGMFVIIDEGSSNGTFVNGMRITRHPLSPGDIVRLGSSEFKFEK